MKRQASPTNSPAGKWRTAQGEAKRVKQWHVDGQPTALWCVESTQGKKRRISRSPAVTSLQEARRELERIKQKHLAAEEKKVNDAAEHKALKAARREAAQAAAASQPSTPTADSSNPAPVVIKSGQKRTRSRKNRRGRQAARWEAAAVDPKSGAGSGV